VTRRTKLLKDKRFFSKHRSRSTMLRNIDGKIIIDKTEKLRIWKEYIEKLYGNNQADTT